MSYSLREVFRLTFSELNLVNVMVRCVHLSAFRRVRVGMNAFNDDSLFYPSSFGTKSPTLNSDGILKNRPGAAGFKTRTELMTCRQPDVEMDQTVAVHDPVRASEFSMSVLTD